MNHHELLDVAAMAAAGTVARGHRYFARSLESPDLTTAATDAHATVEELRTDGTAVVPVDTPAGTFEAAYRVWEWHGPDAPTLVYHHGSGEWPFDFRRYSWNTFRRLFVGTSLDRPVNLVVLRAPFHDHSPVRYLRAMGDLANFVGTLAASTALADALVHRLRDRGVPGVVLSGISLGGLVTNLHRACFGSADRYVPLLAGANVSDIFVSSAHRRLTATDARQRADHLADRLDFEGAFCAVDAPPCRPLLGRHDRVITLDDQHDCYRNLPLELIDAGHVSGVFAAEALREHVLGSVRAVGDAGHSGDF